MAHSLPLSGLSQAGRRREQQSLSLPQHCRDPDPTWLVGSGLAQRAVLPPGANRSIARFLQIVKFSTLITLSLTFLIHKGTNQSISLILDAILGITPGLGT